MPKIKDPRYVVHCGDTDMYFAYGRLVRESNLQRIFKKRIKLLDGKANYDNFFPGLILRDAEGRLWKPIVRNDKADLIPVPEE